MGNLQFLWAGRQAGGSWLKFCASGVGVGFWSKIRGRRGVSPFVEQVRWFGPLLFEKTKKKGILFFLARKKQGIESGEIHRLIFLVGESVLRAVRKIKSSETRRNSLCC